VARPLRFAETRRAPRRKRPARPGARGSLRRKRPARPGARGSLTLVFFLAGLAIASWAPHIPQVRSDLALSSGALGLALLGLPLGALVAQPLVGAVTVRMGSRPVVLAGVLLFAAVLPLPVLAPSGALLFAALALVGIGAGSVDVSMNVQGSSLEGRMGRPILSSLHAAYSFGALAGAASGSLAEAAGMEPAVHLAGTSAVLALAGSSVAPRLLPADDDARRGARGCLRRRHPARPGRGLAALGAIGFCVAVAEGAALDWSAVYMRDSLRASAGLAGAAFVAFSATWASTRLVADRLRARWGSPGLLRRGGLLAAIGFAGGLAGDSPVTAIAGFACLGAGVAAVFPVMIGAAGRAPGFVPAAAIAAVSTTAYAGFMAGPPAIGLLAQGVGLSGALALLVLLALVVAFLAPATRSADAPAATMHR
jgi:MFS family permease